MKNFWDRPPTISLEYFQCFDREQLLRHFKLYLINSTIRRDYTERLDWRRFVRTSAKVKFEISSAMTQTQDSGAAIHRSMQLLSKKVTIVQLSDRWNFSNFFTSKRLASMSPLHRLSELLSSPTSASAVKTWKSSHNNSNNSNKQNPPNKRKWTTLKLWLS